jgi:hypothetical protein
MNVFVINTRKGYYARQITFESISFPETFYREAKHANLFLTKSMAERVVKNHKLNSRNLFPEIEMIEI